MTTRAVEQVDEWDSTPFSDGYRGLHDLADDEFSGVVRAGRPKLCMLKGTVVGILDGDIDDFEDASGTAYRAPSPALPLLALMQERNDEVRAKYYTEDTAISDVDTTLSDGGFTGFIELSENVLSGDYYVVYHEGRRMAVAFVGNAGQLLTEDEAFERADGEVGIYEVRPAEVDPVEIPEVEEPDDGGATGAAAGAAGAAGGAAAGSDSDADAAETPDSAAGDAAADEGDADDADAAVEADAADEAAAADEPGTASGSGDVDDAGESAGTATTADSDGETAASADAAEESGTSASADATTSRDSDTAADEESSVGSASSAPDDRRSAGDSGRAGGASSADSPSSSSSGRSESSPSRRSGSTERESRADRSTNQRTDRSTNQRTDRTGSEREDRGSTESSRAETGRAGSSGSGRAGSSGSGRAPSESGQASSDPRSGGGSPGRDRDAAGRADAETGSGGRAGNAGSGPASGTGSASGRAGAGGANRAGASESTGTSGTAGAAGSAGSADDLETRSIPSLDPAQTGPADGTGGATALGGGIAGRESAPEPSAESDSRTDRGEAETGRTAGQATPSGAATDSRATEATDAARDAGSSRQGTAAEPRDSAGDAGNGRADPAGRQDQPEPAGAGGDVDARIADLEAELEDREIEIERLEGDLADAEAEADDLRGKLEDVRSERDDLRSRIDDLESERDRLREERDDLQAEVERLESELDGLETEVEEIEEEYGAAVDADRRMSAGEALDQTNLFVRYESKGQATLESAHGGNASRQEVGENLGLEYHTQFETEAVSVGGRSFDEFLRNTIQYRFVTWVINDLLYEIRDTGKNAALQELYDAIPRIDRAELNGTVNAEYTEDGQERRTQESFDVVIRDRMGNPLMVANLNDSRQAASESMMSALVTASSHVGESTDSLAASFLVTSSFFEPEALETAADATSGGILNRDKRESFVKLARKRGYHLCLVEAREDKFHLAVPEL